MSAGLDSNMAAAGTHEFSACLIGFPVALLDSRSPCWTHGRPVGLTVAMLDSLWPCWTHGHHVGLTVAMLDSGCHVGSWLPCGTRSRLHVGLPLAVMLDFRLPWCALDSMLGANGHSDTTISICPIYGAYMNHVRGIYESYRICFPREARYARHFVKQMSIWGVKNFDARTVIRVLVSYVKAA